jgi:hypothetical protein
MQLLAQLPTAFYRPQLFAAHALRSCSLLDSAQLLSCSCSATRPQLFAAHALRGCPPLDFCAAARLLLLSYSLIFSQPFYSPFPFLCIKCLSETLL